MSGSHETGESAPVMSPPLSSGPSPQSTEPKAYDPPNVDSPPPTPPDSSTVTYTRNRTLTTTITPVGRRSRRTGGSYTMDNNRGLGINYSQPGDSQTVQSSSTTFCQDDTVPGESRRTITARTITATRRLVTFDELSPEDQARVLAAADADDEEEDETVRGDGDNDSDIDGEIDLCEVPASSSQTYRPYTSYHERFASTPVSNLRQRRVSFLSPPTGTITIYDPENATSDDGTYQLPFAVAMPFALEPLLPLVRFILLGWVLAMTFMLIATCVGIGVGIAFCKAIWDLLHGWRGKRDSPTSNSLITTVPALFITFCLSVAFGFGNVCYTLYQVFGDWETMSKQRFFTSRAGRGGPGSRKWR